MKNFSTLSRAALALVSAGVLITATAADRPERRNQSYNPEAAAAASSFGFSATGVVVKIKSANMAKDGTITTRFTITDADGHGLDVNGVQSPGTLTVRFVAAYIPKGKSQYTAYTTSVAAATTNKNPSQTQAGTDTGGTFTLVDAASGTYEYTFGKKAPATFDDSVTHSIGMQAERNLSEFGVVGNQTSDDVFTFVPNGSPVTTVRDIVNEASCNQCHDPISAHGSPGPRKKMAYCVLCHTPQSVNPDTLNTADMKVFIHKLHMGSSLASVKAGGKYFMVHRGSISDFSDIVFPQAINNCTTCHASGPKQADNFKTNPSQAACGSCHETVNFATGENHASLPQADDTQCASCHGATATADFDNSVPGSHVVANNSASLPGIVTQVLKVDNATAGSAPTVTFKVTDKAGNPVDISKLTQIRVILSGPNTDYQTGPGGIEKSENPATTAGTNGVYTYTMTNKIPSAAAGSYTVSIQARNSVTLAAGTPHQVTATDSAKPVEFYFSVDASKVATRRQVVSTAKCSACHQNLTFVHGGTRAETQECVICHNPTLADGTSKQSVSFATQIHSIHRGENLKNPYILGTTNYQDVRFPGDLRDCNMCHVGSSYQVDNVGATAMVASPGSWLPSTPPISAACQGCHDSKSAAVHAMINNSQFGESCVTCHGQNAEYSVDKVHARTQ
ncbi:MAG: OmcA/MtrC family decaheme c-type cytochrome [Acidobacteriia bacterium]|nr:OmcA/MtrC family decaheme c-type cytochrome [Terriglobia bacterium]